MSNASDADRLIRHNAIAHDRGASLYDEKHTEIFNAVEQERCAMTVAEVLSLAGLPATEVLDLGRGPAS